MSRPQSGFTLLEVLLATVGGALLLAGLMSLLYVLFNQQSPTTVTATTSYGTNEFYVAPSSKSLVRALNLLDQFQTLQADAAATFVLGGYREVASQSPTGGQAAPIADGYLFPAASGVNAAEVNISASNIPQTAAEFRTYLGARSGMSWESSYDASDFTVVTMSSLVGVSSITQVRRFSQTVDGISMVLYEVVLDKSLGSTRDAVEGSPTQNRFAYRMALPAAEDSWTISAGARHYWFRWDTTWNRKEEGPTLLVFPDPFLLAGDQPAGDTKPFSRFLFFLSPNS